MKALVVAALALAACGKTSAFQCETSKQCTRGSETGVCVQNACAFEDSSCPGGYKFDPAAGALAGQCTSAVDGGTPDGPMVACGDIGQACCASGNACVGGASCSSGTCAVCDTDVALGRRFSCLLAADHTVWCAGVDDSGQLGNGMTSAMPSATRVQVKDGTTNTAINDATAVSAGRDHACVLRSGGSVWCWGNGATTAQQVSTAGGPLMNMVDVQSGDNFNCVRDAGGGVMCWGSNDQGQLGDGTTTSRGTAAPVLVAAGGAALTGATELVIGRTTACIRKADSSALCWGAGDSGQFGDGTTNNHPSPVQVAMTSSISAGMFHLCFVGADASVSCAGWGGHSRLGGGNNANGTPADSNRTALARVMTSSSAPFTGAAKVVLGAISCAIMTDTSLQCWGDSIHGQAGTGGSPFPQPVRTLDGTALTGIDRVVTHWAHTCAHRASGEWLCWGRNASGELGDGTFQNRGYATPLKASCP